MIMPPPFRLRNAVSLSLLLATSIGAAQDVRPFPPPQSSSIAGKSLKDSRHQWRKTASRLPADAPNILLVMLDDAGYAQADTVGGEVHAPTLTRIAQSGIRYNAFHTSASSSPTRASLLTGRNPHRVGAGVIAELANDFDGYTGVIPKSSATGAEVLRHYGYSTVAYGKWHNTPLAEATARGPFDRWPTGYGFEQFYGFIGSETSQFHPNLIHNTTPIETPRGGKYHLTEDLADQAISWLRQRKNHDDTRPFFMYWTPGAVHAPLQVFQQWADKYKGKFDGGWDAYRTRVFERQKAMGWIPRDTQLTPRPAELAAWDSLTPEQKKLEARLMEVYAGFLEHTDAQVGRLIDELEQQGVRDNTVVVYLFSDNGSSAEGLQGDRRAALSVVPSYNGVRTSIDRQLAILNDVYGGANALGGPKLDVMYHAGWGWAGMTPFAGAKSVAGYFGGTRAVLTVSWPRKIKPDATVRQQFHHVNDIMPTLYDMLGITPPKVVNGIAQDPIDGISMAYTFDSATAPTRKAAQYFELGGSRAIYDKGWIASVSGPRLPWTRDIASVRSWDPVQDRWALFELTSDFSQANDVSQRFPEKLDALKRTFDNEAQANKVYPLGGNFYVSLHPEQRIQARRSDWHLDASFVNVPPAAAPNLRYGSTRVAADIEVSDRAEGVLYTMGGGGGGLTLYVKDGYVNYEYNVAPLGSTRLRSSERLAPGRHVIEVETLMASKQYGAPAQVTLRIDGREVGRTTIPATMPQTFVTGMFNVGESTGAPVSLEYFDLAPFKFNGKINDIHVRYL